MEDYICRLDAAQTSQTTVYLKTRPFQTSNFPLSLTFSLPLSLSLSLHLYLQLPSDARLFKDSGHIGLGYRLCL